MKPLMIAFAALALSAASFGASQAQDSGSPPPSGGGGGSGGVRQACAADIAKFCANVDRSGRRQCMQDNRDQLSDGCKSAIMSMRSRQSAGGDSGSTGGGGGGDGGSPPPAH